MSSSSFSPVSNSPLSGSISPMELRHMTSNPNVHGRETKASNRHSQLLQAGRMGSKTPVSIPSSPTSVHSSSSAIFERDIEPIPCPSPPHPHHPHNPHRIPRSKTTETIEQSVPSVLDAAASILASTSPEDEDQISIVAPATNVENMASRSSGFASPIGSFRSRSPSPIGSPGNRASLLLSLPQVNPHSPSVVPLSAAAHLASPISPMVSPLQTAASGASKMQPQVPASQGITPATATPSPLEYSAVSAPRPVIQTQLPDGQGTTPAIVTPTSTYFSTSSSVGTTESSPTTTTREHPPHALPTQSPSGSPLPQRRSPSTNSILPPHYTSSHPPSPTNKANKRLSFMSYSDLLSSTPALALPLSALTSSASTTEPPHIPSVSGYTQSQSAAASLRDFMLGPGSGNARDRDSIAMVDDIGGEWEREGMGRGLEERLEALMSLQGNSVAAPS